MLLISHGAIGGEAWSEIPIEIQTKQQIADWNWFVEEE